MTGVTAPMRLAAVLPGLVESTFNKALTRGALTYFPSEVKEIPVNSFIYQVRFSPALANKPKGPRQEGQKRINPFENPPPDLFITDLSATHRLVLNKFAVVRQHFILITTQFKEQTHVLETDDLWSALDCIKAYAANGRQLFAFFNSGSESGASQPHRHIQLLPAECMEDGLDEQHSWSLLADRLATPADRASLPFTVYAERIDGLDAESLHAKYISLYSQAFSLVKGREPTSEELQGEAAFSYNIAMTQNVLVLCPRKAEGAPIFGDDGAALGQLSLNGTLLAGTALVRTQQELDYLNSKPDALKSVLAHIGYTS